MTSDRTFREVSVFYRNIPSRISGYKRILPWRWRQNISP